MRLHDRSLSKLGLLDILKRKRSNLKSYLNDSGIETYELLLLRCDSMGVVPPSNEAFLKAKGVTEATAAPKVSSPSEGLIVLSPPKLIEETSGKQFDIEEPVAQAVMSETEKQPPIEDLGSSDASKPKKSKK